MHYPVPGTVYQVLYSTLETRASLSHLTPHQSRRVTINLENGQVKTFWYAYVLDILLRLYTRTYPRKLEVK